MLAKDGVIYAPADQTLAAFSPAGTPLWSTAIPELVAQFPPALADDGNLWISTWHALLRYGSDGSLRQRLESYSLWMDMPLVDSQGVAYFATADCTVHAVDRDGNEKWMPATSVLVWIACHGCKGTPILFPSAHRRWRRPQMQPVVVVGRLRRFRLRSPARV
jgi:outer membrane protein assembly factor BamB